MKYIKSCFLCFVVVMEMSCPCTEPPTPPTGGETWYSILVSVKNNSSYDLFVDLKLECLDDSLTIRESVTNSLTIKKEKSTDILFRPYNNISKDLGSNTTVSFYHPKTNAGMSNTDPSLLIKKITNAGRLFVLKGKAINDYRLTITDEMLE